MEIQNIVVIIIVSCAAFYLAYKFIIKPKKHDCDKCGH